MSPGDAEFDIPSARVPEMGPDVVGMVTGRGFHNYRGPRDWYRMTRVPDIGRGAINALRTAYCVLRTENIFVTYLRLFFISFTVGRKSS